MGFSVRNMSLSYLLYVWSDLTCCLPCHKASSEIECTILDANQSTSRGTLVYEETYFIYTLFLRLCVCVYACVTEPSIDSFILSFASLLAG